MSVTLITMLNSKVVLVVTLLLVSSSVMVPGGECGFVLDKLRNLVQGICNVFHRDGDKVTENTPLIAHNQAESTTVIYDIDVRFGGESDHSESNPQRKKREIPKHELMRRLFTYRPVCDHTRHAPVSRD